MSGTAWIILTYSVIIVFLVLLAGRVILIARRPEHLRWELAPVPKDKGKTEYGGSYLEDFEWWKKPRQTTRLAPIIYMITEIFSLKSVKKNNRLLWPFSLALHYGVYFYVLTLVLHFSNAMVLISGATPPTLKAVIIVAAAAGSVLGITGTIGLILKRLLDDALRPYSAPASFLKLVLLLAVFLSGGLAVLFSGGYAGEMGMFVKKVLTMDAGLTLSAPAAAHVWITYLFLLVLPLTNMVHVITKHFTYYAVRWNDEPVDARLSAKLAVLSRQRQDWSAPHARDGNNTWAGLAGEKSEKD